MVYFLLAVYCITDAVDNSDLRFYNHTMSIKNKPSIKVSLEDLPDLMTIREVASLLRVSPLTIKRWGKKNKLPAIRINSRGDRRYRKDVVMKLLGIEKEE